MEVFHANRTHDGLDRSASNSVRLRAAGGELAGRSGEGDGTVTYLQRIALPRDAVVHVLLANVSLQDAPALTIAEQTLTEPGQVPIPFERRGWR